MWPDPENANNAAAADAVPTEKFAMMPDWLGWGFWMRGKHGYWNPRLTGGVPQQVIKSPRKEQSTLIVMQKSSVSRSSSGMQCCLLLLLCWQHTGMQVKFKLVAQRYAL